MSEALIKIPPKLIPVFQGEARYRGSFGGRGSAKTRTFAKMTAVRGYQEAEAGRKGVILCGREYMNSLDESSLEEVKDAIRSEAWLNAYYDIGEKYIKTKNGRVKYAFAGLRHNLNSIKSKSKILLCWIDEAEPVSEAAWKKLIPTVREENSEIWVTWNPENEGSATDLRFKRTPPDGSKIIEMNWRDNPWFPAVLERERLNDQKTYPESYAHIWEGGYKEIVEGSIYGKEIRLAKEENRITKVPYDSSKPVDVFFDLGWADFTSMWFVQTIGMEIRVVDYYQNHLLPIQHYIQRVQNSEYMIKAVYLPHDAKAKQLGTGRSIEEIVRGSGLPTRMVAKLSIEDGINAVRTLFNSCWFDESRCADGLSALRNYRYDYDSDTGKFSKQPVHDEHSHGADAFRYVAVGYKNPVKPKQDKIYRS
jgi:phage terminase large subunit